MSSLSCCVYLFLRNGIKLPQPFVVDSAILTTTAL